MLLDTFQDFTKITVLLRVMFFFRCIEFIEKHLHTLKTGFIEGFKNIENNGYFKVLTSAAGKITVDATLVDATLVDEEAGRPVNITIDPLIVHRYDGINPDRLTLSEWEEFVDYCEDTVYNGNKRLTFNGGLDQDEDLWRAAQKICKRLR